MPKRAGVTRRRTVLFSGWGRRLLILVTVAAAIGLSFPAGTAEGGPPSDSEEVIVTAGTLSGAANVVTGLGGAVVAPLGIINGVAAQVTPLIASLLAAIPDVTVVPDVAVHVAGSAAPSTRAPADVFPVTTGATQLEASGDDGSGVVVAVVDTGIDPVADLQGRIVGGVDLSGAGNPYADSYGHGTFVAGLIASSGSSSGGQYQGEAPGASLVSVKVAGASGVTDLVKVIEGIQWVMLNQARYDIRVINLSLGALATMSTLVDPLDQAVEAAWRDGLVVVTSSGNGGPSNGSITSPGDDPLAITVGALDDAGTVSPADDSIPAFSGAGPTSPDGWVKPDLVASGQSVVSLRAPGSTIDQSYPTARVGTANFAGSGTSFSTAITSGAVALILHANPELSPDQVKGRLLATASRGPVGNPFVDGHGVLDVAAAATVSDVDLTQPSVTPASLAVGGTVSLSGTWAASPWDPTWWHGWSPPSSDGAGPTPAGANWPGVVWNGTVWTNSVWTAGAWNGWAWNSATWQGPAWDGAPWTTEAWNDSQWG